MPSSPKLYVEGKNDQFVIANLVKAHGIELTAEGTDPTRPVIECSATQNGQTAGVNHLINTLDSKIKVSEKPVGFVFDADPDIGIDSRWESVRHRLSRVAVESPIHVPAGGFVGYSTKYEVSVGIWLMPDNQCVGTLETFLKDLIGENDRLIEHAVKATSEAAGIDQRYPPVHKSKAELHTWLAWQIEPGLPYGTAIASRYFKIDTPVAQAFVNWFRELYGL